VVFIATKTPALKMLKDTVDNITHKDSEIIYTLNGMGYDSVFEGGIPSVVYISGQQHDDYIEHFVNQKIILPETDYTYIDELIAMINVRQQVNFELLKSSDFHKIRYEKLVINVGINSVTALSKNTSKIFEDDKMRSEEHTSELQSRFDLVCRLLLEKENPGGSARLRGRPAGAGAVRRRREEPLPGAVDRRATGERGAPNCLADASDAAGRRASALSL